MDANPTGPAQLIRLLGGRGPRCRLRGKTQETPPSGGTAVKRSIAAPSLSGRSYAPPPGWATVAAFFTAALLAACDVPPSLRVIPEAGTMAVARLEPSNNSTVRGTISFTQRGGKAWISGYFVELFPGSHSVYIHTVGNCRSFNAASAGPVWNIAGAAVAGKRTGDLPRIYAGTEGTASLQMTTDGLSVGTGEPNDVIGHSVVVHGGLDPDPKAEFGVRNDWLACGVIERSQGFDLKDLL